jgi:MarR family transcriptional regulator, transcriptional regulator for hemolysin
MAARALRHDFDTRARDSGLTSAQWRTVAIVHHAPGSTQRQIARLLGVGDVTAGRMVDRLCEDGVLERRADPADRRAHRVYLTDSAAPLLATLQALAIAEEARAFAGLDDADRAALHAHLDTILGNLRGELD